MINSVAGGTFGIDKSGNLYVESKITPENHSTYYFDKLSQAAKDPETTIYVEISPQVDNGGQVIDIDKDRGGGTTLFGAPGTGTAAVIVSGNGSDALRDTEGNPLPDGAPLILAHELVGHAIPFTEGSDTGNAIDNENKVRAELGDGNNQQRASDPRHVEYY